MTPIERLKARRDRYLREVEQIRADSDLNDSAKARRIGPLFRAFKAEEGEAIAGARAEVVEKAAEAGRKAFAVPSAFGSDPALAMLSYRAALDSVEGIGDPKVLAAKLERALLTGDKALARAAAWRANELGDESLVRKYMESDQDAARAFEEWGRAYEGERRLKELGPSFAFGYGEVEEPREARRPEARAEKLAGRG